jgi:hypothetical protein
MSNVRYLNRGVKTADTFILTVSVKFLLNLLNPFSFLQKYAKVVGKKKEEELDDF